MRFLVYMSIALLWGSMALKGVSETINSVPEGESTFLPGGRHVIAELHGCTNCDYSSDMYGALQVAVQACKATLLHAYVHQFTPQGMTAIAVLSESHIALHTWPEAGYVALDVFTCGTQCDPMAAVDVLQEYFGAEHVVIHCLERGSEVDFVVGSTPSASAQ